jgi:putative NADH-flavin reductase
LKDAETVPFRIGAGGAHYLTVGHEAAYQSDSELPYPFDAPVGPGAFQCSDCAAGADAAQLSPKQHRTGQETGMKVLVVGAAGRTGRAVVQQAQEAGHEVTAFVHAEGGYAAPGVTVRVGEAGNRSAMAAAITGQEAVIDTVGGKKPYRRTTLEASAAEAIIDAMKGAHVRRLIVTSSLGVGDSRENATFFFRILQASFLRGSSVDKAKMEEEVQASDLDWVIIRPAALSQKPATGDVRIFTADKGGLAHTISRSDLASFLVAQLVSDHHLRQAVTIASGT